MVPVIIEQLCERFERNSQSYHSASYNEAQLRQEFLNPMLKALGWDMENEQGFAEAYKEVIHEDSIKVEGSTKAPDYCFRIGGTKKFFLEAKKPQIAIRDIGEPAYQLRRYAWSAKLPLSILTNFEEFAVYDCRWRPSKDDKPSKQRTEFIRYNEYPEKWEKIASIFSRDAILRGSFDKYAADLKGKRGTQEVDDEFLKEIEFWRETLARHLALRNKRLSIAELNYAVGKIIDRLLFLRVCEDRGIEEYGQLRELARRPNIYDRLLALFRRSDERYNSGLFHFKAEKGRAESPDLLTPTLHVDDNRVKDIVKTLYYPESPYEFSVFPADILGQVYEQFLGKVIIAKGKTVDVEYKPEVKKAGGVYYTPTYIVDYIVKHTVGKLVEGKTAEEVAELRILDPACGSGSFLIGAYQYLLDWHLQQYVGAQGVAPKSPAAQGGRRRPGGSPSAPTPIYQTSRGEWRLTLTERKRILLNNIYGVDIDAQATEVTKLSLLLKVLEGESEATVQGELKLRHHALPDLAENIKCGNSLVGPDILKMFPNLSAEEVRRINPFDWQKEFASILEGGGFDAVIGNPPYGMSAADENINTYFGSIFTCVEGRFENFELFIERGLGLTRTEGYFGYIVPSPLLTNLFSRKTRKFILERTAVVEVVNFAVPVFALPTVHTCVIVLSPGRRQGIVGIRKQIRNSSELVGPCDYDIAQSILCAAENLVIDVFADPTTRSVMSKLESRGTALGDSYFIRQCIKTGDDDTYVKSSQKPLAALWKPTLRGRSIGRYSTNERNLYLRYGPWLARNWQNRSFYETPKVAIRETGKRLIATIDRESRYLLSSLYSVYPKEQTTQESLEYLLGILNSTLATYYLKAIALDLTEGAFAKFRTNQLGRLPIRTIDFTDKTDKARHDRMVKLVEKMLELNRRLGEGKLPEEKTQIERQIAATDRQIDELVYELYGLTEEEIKIVEGGV